MESALSRHDPEKWVPVFRQDHAQIENLERDADVLGGVVMVDMEIAIRLHRNVDAGMAGEQVQHMVEEADARRNTGNAGAVEVHRHLDVGLLGLALDGRAAHENWPFPENGGLLTGG